MERPDWKNARAHLLLVMLAAWMTRERDRVIEYLLDRGADFEQQLQSLE